MGQRPQLCLRLQLSVPRQCRASNPTAISSTFRCASLASNPPTRCSPPIAWAPPPVSQSNRVADIGATELGDLFAVGNHAYTLDPPRLTALSDYSEDNARTPADRSAPDARHQNRANVLFCDGHVEALSLKDLGYVVRANGSVAAIDPAAHNRKFSGNGTDADPPAIQ